jgi:16S rRNA (cytosine1402-N4)-methyltransferase
LIDAKPPHAPVLLDEVVAIFDGVQAGAIVDCTLGYGGHAFALLSRFRDIKYVGVDRDETAIGYSLKRLERFSDRFSAIKAPFADAILTLNTPIAGVLADLGVSSLQLDDEERGFGFNADRLDMRMDKSASFSAFDVVNGYEAEALARIFSEFGEEPRAKKMAEFIAQNRPFHSAKALAEAIAANFARGKIHSATLIFQAIRIEVNGELTQLETLLDNLENLKPRGANVAIISFHSLEDRIVKDRFRKWAQNCVCPKGAWRCECGGDRALGKILTKKPIAAGEAERKVNPRSRSAKLRGFRFN